MTASGYSGIILGGRHSWCGSSQVGPRFATTSAHPCTEGCARDPTLTGWWAGGTRPAASEDEIQNFLAVHLARGHDDHTLVAYRWVHYPDLNTLGGQVLADDLTWICDAVAEMQLGTPALP